MKLLDIAVEVGKNFEIERRKIFKENELAEKIRKDWPDSFVGGVPAEERANIKPRASPGIGQWSSAPFIAFLHDQLTDSPKRGYYPVILFEPGFASFCLVLVQGADLLKETFGTKEALHVVSSRAPVLREAAGEWRNAGFEIGPFHTYSRVGEKVTSTKADTWSDSVAFGKRYSVNTPPTAEDFSTDLINMLRLYRNVFSTIGKKFEIEDEIAKKLLDTGELPSGPGVVDGVRGRDGAMKVAQHKALESRSRNPKLIKQVKAFHGHVCQGCQINLRLSYGEVGKNFIEAHHLVPLATLPKEGAELSEKDFAVLCPTCHRIIHRLGCPPLLELNEAIHVDLQDFHSSRIRA